MWNLLCAGSLLLVAIVGTMLWQHARYLKARRHAVQDRQSALYRRGTFHVVTFLKAPAGADLLDMVRALKSALEANGNGRWIYAGKVVINVPSAQIGPVEWSAVTLIQYQSRAAYERHAASQSYTKALARFEAHYTHGGRRSAAANLLIPQLFLLRRALDVLSRRRSQYPFQPIAPEALTEQVDKLMTRLRSEPELGRRAAVVVNLQQKGDARMRAADARYVSAMVRLMAERGYGPMHVARAEALPGGHRFDNIAIVYYPGTLYFADMLGSTFYQSIFCDKQLADNQSTITVPILNLL